MILTFFLGKAAFCLRVVIRVDVRITAWRGMDARLFHSRNLHLIWALNLLVIMDTTFPLLKRMKKAPEELKVLPKFLQLKLSSYLSHSCKVAFRKPVWSRGSLST